ncbi:MAG: YitT family protein [Clostridia bacterium]|nr:YitT family protein [Clostridia bacterium]MBO4428364.1 YitT family protein [Clostridia bacterium]
MKSKKTVSNRVGSFFKGIRDVRPLNFLILTLAGAINAFGVTMFLFPVKLYDSGISGLSMLLDQVTPHGLSLALFLIVLNFPIFILGARRQGLAFTVYSIYAVGIYALTAYLIMHVLPIDISSVSPLAERDLLLCAIFGGVISGIGSGLTIRYGGAIDGIDIISVLFAKKIGISIGTFVMIFNTALYIVCGLVIKSWILPLYSIVTYFVGSKTVDFITEGFDRSICAMIVTTKASEISAALAETFQSSGTIVDAIGGYTKENKQILYFVVNHFQINKLKTVVHGIDDKAFISLQDVSDIVKNRAE